MTPQQSATLSPECIEAVSSLSAAWRDAGLAAPSASSTSSGADCCMPDCTAMTFVQIKTSEGPRRLCFKHFELVDEEQRVSAGE